MQEKHRIALSPAVLTMMIPQYTGGNNDSVAFLIRRSRRENLFKVQRRGSSIDHPNRLRAGQRWKMTVCKGRRVRQEL